MKSETRAGRACVTQISSDEVAPVQAWNDWKPAPVYTIVLLCDLFCLFFASLSVN